MKGNKMLPKAQETAEIEVSGKHKKLRIILFVVALVIALTAFGVGISFWLSESAGWKTLTLETAMDNCSGDFICYYYLEEGGQKGKNLLKSVTNDYAEACTKAYRIFNATNEYTGNLATVNKNVNTEVSVDSTLYKALTTMQASGRRDLYLAPIYSYYYELFYAYDDSYAEEFDPSKNADVATKFTQILSYVNSDEHIKLELLGQNKVKLTVSAEYSAFVEAEGYKTYLDFFVFKNAFIIDYLSDFMTNKGHGVLLSSFDGYMRNSLANDKSYSLNIFDVDGKYINPAGNISGTGAVSVVRYRDYSTSNAQFDYWYTYADGTVVTPFLTEQGLSRSCIHDLVTYSYTDGCAEVALSSISVYTAEEFSETDIANLKTSNVYSVYCMDKEVRYNDASLENRLNAITSADYSYSKRFVD